MGLKIILGVTRMGLSGLERQVRELARSLRVRGHRGQAIKRVVDKWEALYRELSDRKGRVA